MASTHLTPQQVAGRVLEIIPNYRQWLRGIEEKRARHCVVGAVRHTGIINGEDEFSQKFWETAQALFPGRYSRYQEAPGSPSWERKVFFINDHEETTYDDIRVILEKIAAGLRTPDVRNATGTRLVAFSLPGWQAVKSHESSKLEGVP
jgi:hypothetical protein